MKKAWNEKFMQGVFFIAACASVLAVALICVFLFANGIPATFIPSALVTIVGTVSTMVITDKNFIAIFKLLDITEAKASIVPLKISL